MVRRLIHLYPGDAGARRELLERQGAWLCASGVELILADDALAESDRALYADVVELPPADQPGAAARALVEWARHRRVDGIVMQTESALRCTGKHLTRAALAAADHPQPRFTLADDAAAVRRFAADHGFPLMLKAA